MKFRKTKLAISSLSIYRNLLKDPVINKFVELIDCLCSGKDAIDNAAAFLNLYNDFFFALASSSTSFSDYIIDKIIYDDNPFAQRCSTGEKCGHLTDAAKKDLETLQLIANISSKEIKAQAQEHYYDVEIAQGPLSELPEWDQSSSLTELPGPRREIKEKLYHSSNWGECLPDLSRFYRETGTGTFAQYYAFMWERHGNTGFFKGVASPDPIRLAELYSYEQERKEVLENTLQFLKGYQANNVLLYGDRGTGKSSTVKALVNEYHVKGLRIIEVSKEYLSDFPEIIRLLRGRSQKFIIFVDDLTFDDSTANYTALKAVLEGGLESRPSNVVIYVTSNRRHLVKETFSDRPDSLDTDEIHKNDSVQEKLSLADRFGITVVFTAPDKDKYLQIASSLAEQRGLQVPQDVLKREALRWANRHNGRSPRTACQFIDWLEGHLAL
ncbi:MAG: ATP-binding protein [Syntrophaceticus sp.]|nr:ATP-binding protein [Syntrophaceticus sp.]